MNDSYGTILKMFGDRNPTDTEVLTWFLIVLFGLPVLLFVIHYLRGKRQASKNRIRAFEILDGLGNQKDLDYLEQQTLEHMAEDVGLKNPSLLITSMDVFDRTVGKWMNKLQNLPWLEMFTHVERLQSVRQKIGHRYLAVGQPPITTRELRLGQRLYMVAPFRGKMQLLSTRIIDLDDLAIRADYFAVNGHRVQFKAQRDMWVFFWSDSGREYQFKTQVFKNFKRPVVYMMLQHGDTVLSQKGRNVFSCDLTMEVTASWAQTHDERKVASPALLEAEEPETLAGSLTELSGSGFTMIANVEVGFNDLIRLEGGVPDFLKEKVGRAVDISGPQARFKFHNLSAEDREKILNYVAPQLSQEVVHKA
ncbi:MAG: hypothetical protein ACI8V2_001399 [Candidatus Latescibacterota bacterium]|jgi:hypothetical protein